MMLKPEKKSAAGLNKASGVNVSGWLVNLQGWRFSMGKCFGLVSKPTDLVSFKG